MDILGINTKVIELCIEKKKNKEVSIYENISSIIKKEFNYNITSEGIRAISRRYRKINNLDENFEPAQEPRCSEWKEVMAFNKDGSQSSEKIVSIKALSSLTPKELLEKHGFDPSRFVLVSAKNSKWNSSLKGTGVKDLYSSSIVVKPVSEFMWSESTIKNLFDSMKVKTSKTVYKKTNYEENGKAIVLPLMDLHFCLKSYKESSGTDYDKEIAEDLFTHIISDVISRVKDKKFEKIFFTIGSDLLNCDNKAGSTTKLTPQSNDGEIEDAIIRATNMIINAIETLREISNVEVIHIPSNHDAVTSFGIANAVRVFYRNNEDVKVDCGWTDRKYKTFGNTLIGFAHDIKSNDINSIVQSDARELISKTTNTLYLLAHYHHESAVDKSGTDVRRLPTISALSRWGYEHGYNSVRKCQTFILDSKYGICDILYTFA